MRKLYDNPAVDIVLFTEEDVFVATSVEGTITDRNWTDGGGTY